jgi:TolB-like protein
MSPEQALGRSTDQRSDIFAFGTLLYEMATGRAAFNGETSIEVLDAVLHAEPQEVSSLRIDLPAEVSEVMQKALAKDPAQRYQHVSELASDLRGWLDTQTAGASSRVSNNRVGRSITFAAIVAAAVSTGVVWNGVPAVPNTSVTTPTPVAIEDVTAGKSRVAVLPFENLTRQSDDDWLANAFSDSLTLGLRSLDGLLLVSRSGIAQAYRDHGFREADRQEPENILRLSKSLGIRYYVHGSYQRIGNQVRVVARLVEIGPGTIKTQESVTDELANLLQLEETLARKFAASLESGGALTSRGPETTSLAAYRAITEGRGSYASGRWREALESFRRGVDLDPDYAEAWALASHDPVAVLGHCSRRSPSACVDRDVYGSVGGTAFFGHSHAGITGGGSGGNPKGPPSSSDDDPMTHVSAEVVQQSQTDSGVNDRELKKSFERIEISIAVQQRMLLA